MTTTDQAAKYCPQCGKESPASYRFCQHCGAAQPQIASDAQHSGGTDWAMLNQIRTEIEDLKAIAASFGLERIRDGTWFNEFIQAMLASYAARIIEGGGVDFFRVKYPGLTSDQIAGKLCELATRYAALAGGASGATASAAFAATIGTAGGVGVVALPAGLAAITAEMLYTTRLQIRLVYDFSIVYGCPINVEDPEDLYKAFCMAYGVAYAAGNAGIAVKAAAPEVARAQIRGLINGQTAAIQQVAIRVLGPRIGRQITQRAILRAAVPVIGVGISATWNYVSTNSIATSARYGLRLVGKLRDAARDVSAHLAAQLEEIPLVIEAVMAIIAADGHFDQYEHEVLRCAIEWLNVSPEVLAGVERRVDINTSNLEHRLRATVTGDLRTTLASYLQLVAVADGVVAETEVALLRRLLAALEQELDLNQLRVQAQLFQRPTNWVQQAAESISTVGSTMTSAVTSWFGKRGRGRPESTSQPPEQAEIDGPLEQIRKLAQLHVDGIISADEFETKKQELLSRL